ncbi:MAG: DNA primase [Deltaproteobacteria bacterium]|nr:DNA primase [Deltaproteobacteria bacterium]
MDNIISLKAQVEQRVKNSTVAASKKDDRTKNDGSGSGIDSDFIMACLNKNELGDGELFKKLYRNDFVFNKSMDSWMSWTGHHWKIDKMDFAHASVEGVASAYQDEAKRISGKINNLMADDKPVGDLQTKRKLLNQRVSALRSNRRRKNCLLFAHTSANPLAIDGSEVDQNPWLLPCANGVINLKTGELEPGRQEDYLLKASPIGFPKEGLDAAWGKSDGNDEGVELWEDTLLEIFSGNQHLVDFLRRICGYALVGEVSESILVVMIGRGRNGKSMIVETISKVMGQLSGAIRSEMLLDQFRVSSSAGPTPDIMALRGLRMAFASETDDGCRISPSRVKWLTGNDTITGRNPHDKYEVHFKPSHTLFLLTNHKPHAPADDFAFWERMVLFPFELSFVDREPKSENEFRSDPQLGKKLEAILPAILAWMVRGCIEWQQDGRLKRPAVIKEAVNEYQRDEDSVGDFIEQCCVVGTDFKVKAADVYSVFEEWWQENVSKRVPLKKRFGQRFGKRFERVKQGTIWYHGVGLVEDDEDVN